MKTEIFLSLFTREIFLWMSLTKFKGQTKRGDHGETLFRVKPFPDPMREQETKWMSEAQIEAESRMESTHWVEAGSGNIAKGG